MKRTLWAITFLVLACVVSDAQDVLTKNCPSISVQGLAGITRPGQKMVFTANISGVDYSKVQFEWKVSVGTIDGPKEPAISVALPTDQKDGDVTATVTVSGLPPGCADHASETASFSLGGDFMEADLYGRLSITDETARLANALDMAAKEGNLIAVIVIRTPKQSRINFNSRVRSITKIMQKLRIPKEKYVFIDGGDGDLQTTIYLLPPSVDPNIFRH